MANCSVCGKQKPFCPHSTKNPALRGVGKDVTRKSQTIRTGILGGTKKKGR